MTRSRGLSALEAAVNVAASGLAAVVTQLEVFPAVGLQATPAQHLILTFTAISFARSCLLRRAFTRFG